MNDFQSGQALTAKDLNELKRLADGQNLPTDGEFIRSNGVNMWKSMNAESHGIDTPKGLDLQIRFVSVEDGDNILMIPFWFVKIGSGQFVGDSYSANNQMFCWDICLDSGHPAGKQPDIARVICCRCDYDFGVPWHSVSLLPFNKSIDDDIKHFDVEKWLNLENQTINSDGAGWFNTGISVDALYPEGLIRDGAIYATILGVSNDTDVVTNLAQQDVKEHTRRSVLILSNQPIYDISLYNEQDEVVDCMGDKIKVTHSLGPSTLIAYAWTRDYTDPDTGNIYKTYDVHYTNSMPNLNYLDENTSFKVQEGSIPVINSETKTFEHVRNGEFIWTPSVQWNGSQIPIYAKTGDSDTEKEVSYVWLDDTWSDYENITENTFIECYIEIERNHYYSESQVYAPYAKICLKPVESDIFQATKDINVDSVMVDNLASSQFSVRRNKVNEKYDYIPLFISYANVVENVSTSGSVFYLRRLLYTHYFNQGVIYWNPKEYRHFDIEYKYDISDEQLTITAKVVRCIAQIGADETIDCEDYEIEDMTKDIWLHITKSGSGEYDIYIDQEYEEKSENEWSIILWKYDNLTEGGTEKGYIDVRPGHISLGEGGEPAETQPRHFDFNNNQVVNCKIYCGNKWVTCGDYSPSPTGGDIYLNVERTTSQGYVISVSQTPYQESDNRIAIKLWEYSDGKPTLDVRPGIIPVFAL